VIRRPLAAATALLAVLLAFSAASAVADAGKRGIDVSRFQKRIDWREVATTKIRFAYVQASRGSGDDCLVKKGRCGEDNYYDRNHERATEAGITVGAYHRAFASGRTRALAQEDAKEEARVFSRSVGRIGRGDMVPVLDVEAPFTDLSPARLRYWVATWLERVERKLGPKPMIYTNASSWAATGDTQRFAKRGHRLWVANFGVDSPAVPASNWAGEGWSMWQFTSTGRVRGIDGNVDKNRLGVGLRKLLARR
jgi:lysozyme